MALDETTSYPLQCQKKRSCHQDGVPRRETALSSSASFLGAGVDVLTVVRVMWCIDELNGYHT